MQNNCLDKTMFQICRTCLQEVVKKSSFSMDFVESNSEPTTCHKLSICVPEMDLNAVPNAVVCSDCFAAINSAYKFKNNCLRTEMQINRYLQQKGATTFVDLAQVVRLNEPEPEPGNCIEVNIKTEDFDEEEEEATHLDVNIVEALCVKKELDIQDDYGFKLEIVNREPVSFNTDDSYASCSAFSEQNNQDSSNSSYLCQKSFAQVDSKQYSDVYNHAKVDVFYQCYICGHINKSKAQLVLHLRVHSRKKWYKTITCKKPYFRNRSAAVKSYKCRTCTYFTKYKSVINTHIRQHLTKRQYKRIPDFKYIQGPHFMDRIKFGKENFSSKRVLKHSKKMYTKKDLHTHFNAKSNKYLVNVHTAEKTSQYKFTQMTDTVDKPFKCVVCEYKTDQKRYLKSHMMTHTKDKDKPFKCTNCEFRTCWKSVLKNHTMTHTGNKPFKCASCDFRTRWKSDLIKHNVMIHTEDKPFHCTTCGYKTSDKGNFRRHMIVHTGDKPFKCTNCEFMTGWQSVLTRHMLTHTGAKPFGCPNCTFRASSNSDLKKHILIHTGEKPFSCTICEFKTNQKVTLTVHMKIHTGEKPFQCGNCEYKSSRKCDLKKHLLIHTGDKPFQCPECEFKTSQKRYLNNHMKTHAGKNLLNTQSSSHAV